MTSSEHNNLFPHYAEVCFCYKSVPIIEIPAFLFLNLIKDKKDDNEYIRMQSFADELTTEEIPSLVNYLQRNISWSDISPFFSLSPDTEANIAKMWEQKLDTDSPYIIIIKQKEHPEVLYRYFKFDQEHPERLEQLLKEHKLYLPSPGHFNDPFDCGLDEETRLTLIECGMGCFSKKNNNVLMYSHYAERHQGFCLGFDVEKLIISMNATNYGMKADIRPVWYFKTWPQIDFKVSPAIWLTCKHESWSYEDEYRLFPVKNGLILPEGHYQFYPESLRSVVFGCRATDECLSLIKSLTNDIVHLEYNKAYKEQNSFEMEIKEIKKQSDLKANTT